MGAITINSQVWVPRSNGGETLGTVQRIIKNDRCTEQSCPNIDAHVDIVFVSWEEQIPENKAYPMRYVGCTDPCVRMVTATFGKWIEVNKLRLTV